VESTLEGVTWETTKLPADQLEDADVKSAYRVKVVLPHDLPDGYFTGSLRMAGRVVDSHGEFSNAELLSIPSEDGTRSRNTAYCELSLQGKVLRRLSIYGPTITTDGVVELGRLMEGRGKTVKLLLKVRDADVDLNIREIATTPSFIQARVEPHQTQSTKALGLYNLYIEVPENAPPFRLPPDRMAQLKIEFDHPRIRTLELPVDLIIMRKAT
jgi:hypothetical protein